MEAEDINTLTDFAIKVKGIKCRWEGKSYEKIVDYPEPMAILASLP